MGGIGAAAAAAVALALPLEDREMRSKIYIFAAAKARPDRSCDSACNSQRNNAIVISYVRDSVSDSLRMGKACNI